MFVGMTVVSRRELRQRRRCAERLLDSTTAGFLVCREDFFKRRLARSGSNCGSTPSQTKPASIDRPRFS